MGQIYQEAGHWRIWGLSFGGTGGRWVERSEKGVSGTESSCANRQRLKCYDEATY